MNSTALRASVNSSASRLHALSLQDYCAQAVCGRNLAEYEGELEVDEQLLEAMLRVAQEVEKRVASLIAVDHSPRSGPP